MTRSMCDQSYDGIWTFSGVCVVCAGVSYLLCSCDACVLNDTYHSAHTKFCCL